jgi:hypothetical protein
LSGHSPKFEGTLDFVGKHRIEGWAWDPKRPNTPVQVDLYDGDTKLATIEADRFRKDVASAKKGDGKHAFYLFPPASLNDGKAHTIRAKIAGTSVELKKSPITFTFESK